MTTENLLDDSGVTLATVTGLIQKFPNLPPRVVVALAVLSMMDRNLTPQRLCGCGCGAFVTGKARCASPACRKRLERERRAKAGPGGRQFNLVLQHEIPVKIPTVPVPRTTAPVSPTLPPRPRDRSSAPTAAPERDQSSARNDDDEKPFFAPLFRTHTFSPNGMLVPRKEPLPEKKPVWDDGHEHSGYLSLAGDCAADYCDECGTLWVSYIPDPPEALGYVSAIWKCWLERFPNRYPCKVRDKFPKPQPENPHHTKFYHISHPELFS